MEKAGLPGQAKFMDFSPIQGALAQFDQVLAGVDAEKEAVGGRRHGEDLDDRVWPVQQIPGLGKFLHGKRVPRWQGKMVFRVVKTRQPQHGDNLALSKDGWRSK